MKWCRVMACYVCCGGLLWDVMRCCVVLHWIVCIVCCMVLYGIVWYCVVCGGSCEVCLMYVAYDVGGVWWCVLVCVLVCGVVLRG